MVLGLWDLMITCLIRCWSHSHATLVQELACCLMALSHYLNQCCCNHLYRVGILLPVAYVMTRYSFRCPAKTKPLIHQHWPLLTECSYEIIIKWHNSLLTTISWMFCSRNPPFWSKGPPKLLVKQSSAFSQGFSILSSCLLFSKVTNSS